MAIVPRLTAARVENKAAPIQYRSPGVATPDAFGASSAGLIDAGEKLQRTGDRGINYALKEKAEDNEREAKDLDVKYSQALRGIGRGDGSEQNPGYYSTVGENALGDAYAGASAAADKARTELLGKATNERVRNMFTTSSKVRLEDELGRMDGHRNQERRRANDTTSAARITEAVDDAAAGYNDPTMLARSEIIIAGEIKAMGERNGWSPIAEKAAMGVEQTKMYRSAVMAALVQNPMEAQKLYDTHKNKIDGAARPEIEKALEAGTVRQQSQGEAARIQATTPDIEAQIKVAKQIKDPKVQDETIQRLDLDHARKVRVKAEGEKELRQNAWQTITDKAGSVDKLTPQQLAVLDGTTIDAMRRFETNRIKTGSGYAVQSKVETKNKLHNLFMDDKQKFANYDLSNDRPDLTEEEYNYWQAQQRQVDAKSEKERDVDASYNVAQTVARDYMKAASINPSPKDGTADARKAAIINETARSVVDRLNKDTNKKPTQAEIREAVTQEVKSLFLTGQVEGGGYFGSNTGNTGRLVDFAANKDKGSTFRRNFVLTDIDKQRDAVSAATGIPHDQLNDVVAGLSEARVPLTAANLRDAYRIATRTNRGR